MNIQKEFLLSLTAKGKRADGRGLEEFRPTSIEKNPIERAEGSARVTMGKTDVIVGVKLGLGTPFPDKPDEGVLIVSAELSPIAAPDFETGPPREPAIELARVVDRGIRESHTVDMKKLCIVQGEKVWTVCIDIQIVNHDGNLIDAYALAAASALANAKLPTYVEESNSIDYTKREKPLPIAEKPIAVTVFKIGDSLLIDPTREEQDISEARLTVTTKEDGNIISLQKGGVPLSLEEIDRCVALSIDKGQELRALL